MYQVVHAIYDRLEFWSMNGRFVFCLTYGGNHFVSDIRGLIRFCHAALYNDGMVEPFTEDGFRIGLIGSQAKGYDIEVTVGCGTIIIGNRAVPDLINDIKRGCMAAIDF